MVDRVDAGRRAFARRDWAETYRSLGEVRDDLDPADLELLATAATLIGDDEGSARAWEAAHRRHLDAGDTGEAARCAFWRAFASLLRGEEALARGWLARCERLTEDHGAECAASGYLLIAAFLAALDAGDPSAAESLAVQAVGVGERSGDLDLMALGVLSHGESLIARGEHARGVARLDEVMVSVTADEVGPIAAGIVYCAVVLECMKRYDYARASEWTRALTAWCDSQPDLVPYRGQCLVHRSQLEQMAGRWSEAVVTIERACARLSDPPHPAIGLASYQAGELHRLAGRFDEALRAYGDANRHGYQPQPGLALLELARGDPAAATSTIRRALLETVEPMQRPPLLAAAVDIFTAIGDAESAHRASDELDDLTAHAASPALDAIAARARGTVRLAEGDPAGALASLRESATAWQRLQLPYEGARTAVVLAEACAALDDRSSATLELEGAERVFTELGAAPDLAALRRLTGRLGTGFSHERQPVVSGRELEVLAQVAAGKTNRQIAAALSISEHTVGRHLENIFAKLGVSTRSAATAYAYEHGLIATDRR